MAASVFICRLSCINGFFTMRTGRTFQPEPTIRKWCGVRSHSLDTFQPETSASLTGLWYFAHQCENVVLRIPKFRQPKVMRGHGRD